MDIDRYKKKAVDFDALVGEVLEAIDIDKEDNKILLTTRSGRKFLIHHYQDCCENVEIVGQDGSFHKLIGKPLIEARDIAIDTTSDDCYSQTTTTLIFRVDDETVISRWVGDSNGYYSESVDLSEIIGKRIPHESEFQT